MKFINQWKHNSENDFIVELFSIDWSSPKRHNYFIVTFLNFSLKFKCK